MTKPTTTRNPSADSAGTAGLTASSHEATGLMSAPARTEHDLEAAEDLFPTETAPAREPIGDPLDPNGGERKRRLPGTVYPPGDDLPDIPNTVTDVEFGVLGRRDPFAFFTPPGEPTKLQ